MLEVQREHAVSSEQTCCKSSEQVQREHAVIFRENMM